jgi:multidrug resistance efflux pump
MKKRTWMKPAGLVALAGALVAGAWNTARSATEGPTAGDVAGAERTAPVKGGRPDPRAALPAASMVGAPGVVEPADRAIELATEVPGVVAEVLVKEGERVAAGAPLLRLHDEVERAAVTAAEADVQAAEAELSKTLRGARIEDVRDAEAQAAAARARAEQSAREASRAKGLVAQGAASQQELDQLEGQASVDAKQAAAAEARWKSVANGSRREDVALARARLAQAEARLAQARAALARLTLTAPVAGEVLEVRVRPGEYSSPGGGHAVVLGDTTRVRARLQVDERDVGRVSVGQIGYVQAEAYGDQQFRGKVVEVGRRMGGKRLVTGEPGEKMDTQTLDVVLELDGQPPLVQGLRVTGFLANPGGTT